MQYAISICGFIQSQNIPAQRNGFAHFRLPKCFVRPLPPPRIQANRYLRFWVVDTVSKKLWCPAQLLCFLNPRFVGRIVSLESGIRLGLVRQLLVVHRHPLSRGWISLDVEDASLVYIRMQHRTAHVHDSHRRIRGRHEPHQFIHFSIVHFTNTFKTRGRGSCQAKQTILPSRSLALPPDYNM